MRASSRIAASGTWIGLGLGKVVGIYGGGEGGIFVGAVVWFQDLFEWRGGGEFVGIGCGVDRGKWMWGCERGAWQECSWRRGRSATGMLR